MLTITEALVREAYPDAQLVGPPDRKGQPFVAVRVAFPDGKSATVETHELASSCAGVEDIRSFIRQRAG